MVRVGETAVLTVVLLLVSSATGEQSYPGVILQHPENQTIPIGGTGTFVCTAQGDAVWYIGNRWVSSTYQTELQGKGFTFVDEDLSSYEYPTVNLSMTVVVVDAEMNGTDIHCTTSGTDGSFIRSSSAFLWIVGPPLPPNVSLDLISWNSMRLSWTAPYTAEHFPINKYIIYTTNSSTGQRSRTDVYPTDGTESLIIVDTPNNCHSLSFEVFAQNSVGTSSAGLISGGFPVGISEFTVDMTVVITRDQGRGNIADGIITFKPPEVCSDESGVRAAYILEVRSEAGEVVYRTATEYHQSDLIEDSLTVDTCSSYSVNITVFVPSFPELGSHTNISQLDVSLECPGGVGNGVFLPAVLGAVGLGFLMLLLVTVGMVLVCLRQRRRKTGNVAESRRVSMSLAAMAPNPIYDTNDISPVYDVIPEPCGAAKQPPQGLRKQVSCDIRYTSTPPSLALENVSRQRSVSFCHSSFSPATPSPREVDKMLRSTFAGSPSSVSQGCVGGCEMYDTLSQKLPPCEEEEKEDNDAEREDCYVLMQSNVV